MNVGHPPVDGRETAVSLFRETVVGHWRTWIGVVELFFLAAYAQGEAILLHSDMVCSWAATWGMSSKEITIHCNTIQYLNNTIIQLYHLRNTQIQTIPNPAKTSGCMCNLDPEHVQKQKKLHPISWPKDTMADCRFWRTSLCETGSGLSQLRSQRFWPCEHAGTKKMGRPSELNHTAVFVEIPFIVAISLLAQWSTLCPQSLVLNCFANRVCCSQDWQAGGPAVLPVPVRQYC